MVTRFYSHFAAEPYFNMAFDETMLASCRLHPATALIRLYSWQPGAISIGLNQRRERAIDWSRLDNTPVVRRITGGRALYHDESELTYAVAVNLSGTVWSNQSVAAGQVYELIADTLGAFLRRAGIEARVLRRSSPDFARRAGDVAPPCFASAARYELMADGRKIVASAQRQIGSAILQHGSLKLTGVASHPALPGLPNPGSASQPLDRKQFEEDARQFCQVLERYWPGTITVAKTASLPGLESRCNLVKSKPLARRDTFEQSTAFKGL